MPSLARRFWGKKSTEPGRSFQVQRPLVLLQSDDWGRVGVRDKDGYDALRAAGIRLGEHPYDFYTLETSEDVTAVHELLKLHRDSTGRHACMGLNFVMTNLDFPKVLRDQFKRIHLLPLTDGLPGNWKREGLFEAYRSGIDDGSFFPSLHGLTHYCQMAMEHVIARNNKQSDLLRTFWREETPYIYWRMPWVGYEYQNPESPQRGFLPAETQMKLVEEAAAIFSKFFSRPPTTACAPGYRSNSDTHQAWSKHGIKVVQNGSGSPMPLHMDQLEMLQMHRTIDFEPGQKDLPIEKYMQLAEGCFARGVPAIISVHSINFHSSLKDFRTITLKAMHEFLAALERKFPNLLYVHDMDTYDIVTRGKFRSPQGMVSVGVNRLNLATRN